MAVRCQPARQFRQREAEQEYDQGARADDDPDAAPAKSVAEGECEQGGKRPRPGAADHLHAGDETAADVLGRILAGISEAQRLLGAEPDAGDEAQCCEPDVVGRECRDDGRQAVQQQVELIDGLAAEAVGELALRQRADEQAEQRGAGNGGDLRGRGEAGAHHVGNQRSQDHVVGDVEEIPRGDQREHAPMDRAHPGIVERRANEALDRLGHALPPPWVPSARHVAEASQRRTRRVNRDQRGMVSPISVRPAASMRSRFRHASTSSPNCVAAMARPGTMGWMRLACSSKSQMNSRPVPSRV